MAVVKGRHAMSLAVLLALIAGCAPPAALGSGRSPRDCGYTLSAADLFPGEALFLSLGRVPGLRVAEGPLGCPAVLLRKGVAVSPNAAALIYVNGVRTAGGCILRDLPVFDVDRIEVYPPGVVAPPGYHRSGTGSILIFLKSR